MGFCRKPRAVSAKSQHRRLTNKLKQRFWPASSRFCEAVLYKHGGFTLNIWQLNWEIDDIHWLIRYRILRKMNILYIIVCIVHGLEFGVEKITFWFKKTAYRCGLFSEWTNINIIVPHPVAVPRNRLESIRPHPLHSFSTNLRTVLLITGLLLLFAPRC